MQNPVREARTLAQLQMNFLVIFTDRVPAHRERKPVAAFTFPYREGLPRKDVIRILQARA